MEITHHRNWKHEDRIFRHPDYPQLPGVKLFMYDFKDVNLFYHRNHPVQLDPKSERFKQYWGDFEKKCLDGLWVEDNGTWVYMFPKLFYYINYVIIFDKESKRFIKPVLTHTEWAIFSYIMCCDGFSGFREDDRYTCHFTVEKLEHNSRFKDDQIFISDFEMQNLPSHCYNSKGDLKIFINPWEYLTRVYLYDDPLGQPLGAPTYDNPIFDSAVLGARGTAKSYCFFLGNFLHSWSFNGVKSYEDRFNVNVPNIFAAASTQGPALAKTLANIKSFYDTQPGRYKYDDPQRPDYMGPFYRKSTGNWDVGSVVESGIKNKNNSTRLKGPSLYTNALTIDKHKVGAGDRTYEAYFEEFGFLRFAKSVYSANKDSLSLFGKKTGRAYYLGTAGDMDTIEEPKEMFEKPGAFDIFGITDYYKNPKRKIGFFLSQIYSYRLHFDKNGNVDVPKILELELKRREEESKEKDVDTVNRDKAFNPIVPDEMLVSTGFSVLPKEAANMQIADIEAFGLYDSLSTYGELEFDGKGGVRFIKNALKTKAPIEEINFDKNGDLSGTSVFYEHPLEIIPDGLYHIIYDPVKNKLSGSSLNSALVCKGILMNGYGKFEDNVVAERHWRDANIEDSYREVVKLALYYKARIFAERNVVGFNDWCIRNGYAHLLVPEPVFTLKSLGFSYKIEEFGFNITQDKLKDWALRQLNTWLISHHDADVNEFGNPTKRKINYIFSKKILNEIRAHNPDDNFDAISCLIGWMILRNELRERLKVESEPQKHKSAKQVYYEKKKHRVRRTKFLR